MTHICKDTKYPGKDIQQGYINKRCCLSGIQLQFLTSLVNKTDAMRILPTTVIYTVFLVLTIDCAEVENVRQLQHNFVSTPINHNLASFHFYTVIFFKNSHRLHN